MENISCFLNNTNERFENKTAPLSVYTVSQGLVGTLIVWMCGVYVIYIVYHIIKYLYDKAPHLQTMLDGFYIQYFATYAAVAMMSMIMQLLIELNFLLDIENQTITEIVAYLFYSSCLFWSLSLATSCVARILSIFWQSQIEAIDDMKCWLING